MEVAYISCGLFYWKNLSFFGKTPDIYIYNKALQKADSFVVSCFAKYETWSASKFLNVSKILPSNQIILTQICTVKMHVFNSGMLS
jgi:hypothetical protein